MIQSRLQKIPSMWLSAIIICVLLVCYILIPRWEITLIDQIESQFVHPSFTGLNTVEQTFRTSVPFSGIRVKMATFGHKAACDLGVSLVRTGPSLPSDPVSVHNRPGDLPPPLYEGKVLSRDISDNGYHELIEGHTGSFPPGSYLLRLSPGEDCREGMISPWFSGYDAYDDGAMVLEEHALPGDLTFSVSHRFTIVQGLLWSVRLMAGRKGTAFAVVMMTLLIGWLAAVIIIVWRGRGGMA